MSLTPVDPKPIWQSDLALVRDVLARRRVAVEVFVQRMRYIPRIVAVTNDRLGGVFDADEIDDLSQEALSRVWAQLGDFAGRSRLESWVHSFVHFTVLERLRHRRDDRHRELGDVALDTVPHGGTEASTPDRLAERMDDALLLAALEQLPRNARDVLAAKLVDGGSFEEIARRTGESANTLKARYYRALRSLRERLAGAFGEEERRS